jgi:translation initiation factor 5B
VPPPVASLLEIQAHGVDRQADLRTPHPAPPRQVDRCYQWQATPNGAIRPALEKQDENTRAEFYDRTSRVIVQLNEQGLNAELYWRNTDKGHTVSLVPTSAITGEGVTDLLLLITQLTQTRMAKSLMYVETLQCTVLEVKQEEGLGTTLDVILVNGTLHEGDTIAVCTMEGPVVTTIRALLTPPPSREMRVKSEYVHHQAIEAAMGVKIVAPGLEKVMAGTGLMVIGPDDDENDIKEEVMRDIASVMSNLETDSRGVTVQASTLGALEALLEYLRKECNPPVPVARVGIGPIFRKDVTQTGIMIEKGLNEFAVILAFDVRVDADARAYAEDIGVRIFTADIIYHLFDQFSAYMNAINERRRQEAMAVAVFPCVLKVLPQHIFNAKDPIVIGVEIVAGILRVGTPLCIPGA